jgi:hypothetical protein
MALPNTSLERLGEQLVVMERQVVSETEVKNQRTGALARLTLS